MKWNTKKSAKTGLAVFASALTLLLAAVLLGTALASLSRPAAVPAETSEDRSPSATVSPVRPILQTAQEEATDDQAEPLDAADYDAALADWGEPYGQPEALRQGYCTVNSLAELDGSLCLFASEVGQDGTERTGLAVCDTGDDTLEWLIPPTSDVTLGHLQEQNGVLYVMAWAQDTRRTLAAFSQDDLSPVSLYTGNFETYQVYGDMVFLWTLVAPAGRGGSAAPPVGGYGPNRTAQLLLHRGRGGGTADTGALAGRASAALPAPAGGRSEAAL